MKLTPTFRLLANAVILTAATALLWWLVGYTMGKGILGETGGLVPFRRAYGYEESALLQLLALALIAPLVRAIVEATSAQGRWVAVGASALGAALLFGDKGTGSGLGVFLFAVAAAAAAESAGLAQLLAALLGALLAALAFVLELPLGTGERLIVMALRAVFFFGPLLLGPPYVEKYVLDRLSPRQAQRS